MTVKRGPAATTTSAALRQALQLTAEVRPSSDQHMQELLGRYQEVQRGLIEEYAQTVREVSAQAAARRRQAESEAKLNEAQQTGVALLGLGAFIQVSPIFGEVSLIQEELWICVDICL